MSLSVRLSRWPDAKCCLQLSYILFHWCHMMIRFSSFLFACCRCFNSWHMSLLKICYCHMLREFLIKMLKQLKMKLQVTHYGKAFFIIITFAAYCRTSDKREPYCNIFRTVKVASEALAILLVRMRKEKRKEKRYKK